MQIALAESVPELQCLQDPAATESDEHLEKEGADLRLRTRPVWNTVLLARPQDPKPPNSIGQSPNRQHATHTISASVLIDESLAADRKLLQRLRLQCLVTAACPQEIRVKNVVWLRASVRNKDGKRRGAYQSRRVCLLAAA